MDYKKNNLPILQLKLKRGLLFVLIMLSGFSLFASAESPHSISLNGTWEMGSGREYTQEVIVPGIHTDASSMNPETLWYKKEIVLPKGNWKFATLELQGARFAPEVFVNGVSVSKENGGMAPTFHLLSHKDVKPGNKVIIEIALKSLKDLSDEDASYTPVANHWRSNISSSLWSNVNLKFHGNSRIDRIIPFINFKEKQVDLAYDITNFKSKIKGGKVKVEVFDSNGKLVIAKEEASSFSNSKINIVYGDILKPWSPVNPNLYSLKLSLIAGKNIVDQTEIPFGIKEFEIRDKHFYLNDEPITLLGGTVVWHRWMRDPEGQEFGYDTTWFVNNVILPLKERGANFMRYHLGVPPEVFLDLCDQYGLAVQYEWGFFHGMPASKESLLEQYSKWLDLAMRHPSVVLIHPYNETSGDELNIVWDALGTILKDFPPLVLEERDVIHIHKYWWSMFENLGLYYDSAEQFPKAIMVDEFGGNYLDGYGDMVGYPSIPGTYLRFLGRNHTRESRLEFHSLSNTKVAEYWRRIDAAGLSPFCIMGSWEDGGHWYLGKLGEGRLKPVWNDLTCAWSPQSVSMEIWDRNFIPNQEITVPTYLFNDTPDKSEYNVRFSMIDDMGNTMQDENITFTNIEKYSKRVEDYTFKLPQKPGKYEIRAELLNRPESVKYDVVSKWKINVFELETPSILQQADISVASDEDEIIQFLQDNNIKPVPLSDTSAKIVLLSLDAWERIEKGDKELVNNLEEAINRGTSVILLDVGDRFLGQGYPVNKGDLGPLQQVRLKENMPRKTIDLFGGIKLTFWEVAEPESHIHPAEDYPFLWKGIPYDHTQLWNGMRAGLIVPASEMKVSGLNQSSFIENWKSCGANPELIVNGSYYAYELQGFFEFSSSNNDREVRNKLKQKVKFLVEDAPSLKSAINPNASINVTNLSEEYLNSANGVASNLYVLANAGKNLTKSPVFMIDFGDKKGKMIISQLLTSGRLDQNSEHGELYDIRYDVVTTQFVLNMMESVLSGH